jgi:hypothetical protein
MFSASSFGALHRATLRSVTSEAVEKSFLLEIQCDHFSESSFIFLALASIS